MDEWVLFAAEQNLDIEKVKLIQVISSKPRKVYKLHEFMKRGAKRPNQINGELWKSKSPAKKAQVEEEEKEVVLTKN